MLNINIELNYCAIFILHYTIIHTHLIISHLKTVVKNYREIQRLEVFFTIPKAVKAPFRQVGKYLNAKIYDL